MPSRAINITDGDLQKQDFDHDQSMGSRGYGTLPAAFHAVQVCTHRLPFWAKKQLFGDRRFIRCYLCVHLQLSTFTGSLHCFTVHVFELEGPQCRRTWKE